MSDTIDSATGKGKTEKYHIDGTHSLADTVDYIMSYQAFENTNFWKMSVEHRQLSDLIDMGAIRRIGDNAYQFVNLTREALDMVRKPNMSWHFDKRLRIYREKYNGKKG